ncbi:HIT family protein [Kribbella lupini]|uniref:HIT family protein n=1 Tax=Kribbella lupini TaxID=291602 RepID=UPI0031D4CDE0
MGSLRPGDAGGADRFGPDGPGGTSRLQLGDAGEAQVDCTFCGIVAGRLPARVVYEDDSAVAFLDIRPLRRGHTLVVPRAHVVDLTAEEAGQAVAAVGPVLQQTTRLLIDRLPADGVSLLQANGSAAGQEVLHLHFHLVPRWAGDCPLNNWTPAADASVSLDDLHLQLAPPGS